MGFERRWLAARNHSSKTLHRTISMCCSLGWGHSIRFISCVNCQWTLLHLYDSNICLAWECCRLWFVWQVALARIDGRLLGISVWHDGNQEPQPMARGYGYVCRFVHCLRGHVGILCSCVSKTRSIYATCPQGSRRPKRRYDRSGRIRCNRVVGKKPY